MSLFNAFWKVYLIIQVDPLEAKKSYNEGITALRSLSLFMNSIISHAIKHLKTACLKYDPCHEKTGFLHMRKQRRRSASR